MSRYFAVLTALLLASPVMADGLSYNFIEGAYARVELDDSLVDVDGDGFGIGGSFEINENFFGLASYSTADFDFGVDLNQLNAGFGFHTGISPNTDFVATLVYVRAEVEAGGFGSIDESGWGASAGLRSMVSDRLEVNGAISYVDFGDGDDTSIGGGVLYNFTDTFAVGANIGFGEDTTTYGVNARLYFGR